MPVTSIILLLGADIIGDVSVYFTYRELSAAPPLLGNAAIEGNISHHTLDIGNNGFKKGSD